MTQRITAVDIANGRIRIPITDDAKSWFPTEPAEVEVVLKGTALGRCRYNPRLGPDRERSGVISIGSVLGTLVHEGERLPIVRNLGGTVYIGDRGSKLRIAEWVNDRPSELNRLILEESRTLADFAQSRDLRWLSPLRADDYRKFSSDFWQRLELPHPDPVADGFWPRRQPNWDAVAVVVGSHGTNGVLLLEAKSHKGEVESTCKASSPEGRHLIINSLERAKHYIGVDQSNDWTTPYYQAANRYAFLYYLRAVRNVPTWLTFVYFTGDAFEVEGIAQDCPGDATGWRATLERIHAGLGLPTCHPLSHFTVELFLPAGS